MSNTRTSAYCLNLTVLVCLSFSAQAQDTSAANTSAPVICSSAGAFGFRFGDKASSAQVPKHASLFGSGCYQVNPSKPHPFFDTYAACVSEFDGKIFQIQAAKTFDDRPAQGSLSLSPAQVNSNRTRGQHVLDGLLAQLPQAVSARATLDEKGRSWEVFVDKGTKLEVSNYLGWAVTLECRNERVAQNIYRQRLVGNR
ncbi:MAG: hypothetical protein RL375_1464 [Pseudomonadota bacterium]